MSSTTAGFVSAAEGSISCRKAALFLFHFPFYSFSRHFFLFRVLFLKRDGILLYYWSIFRKELFYRLHQRFYTKQSSTDIKSRYLIGKNRTRYKYYKHDYYIADKEDDVYYSRLVILNPVSTCSYLVYRKRTNNLRILKSKRNASGNYTLQRVESGRLFLYCLYLIDDKEKSIWYSRDNQETNQYLQLLGIQKRENKVCSGKIKTLQRYTRLHGSQLESARRSFYTVNIVLMIRKTVFCTQNR